MKITVTFEVTECSAFDVSTTLAQISSMMGGMKLANAETGVVVDTAEETGEAVPGVDTAEDPVEAAKAKKAAAAKARRAKKKAEKDAGDAYNADLKKAPDATEGELKKAVKAAIEAKGIDAVRAVFGGFKGKSGDPCVKLSDVKDTDFGRVVAALA